MRGAPGNRRPYRDPIIQHLLGANAFDDTPVIVPREVFAEHAHLLGDSGSGKTSLGLASIIAQLIRFADSSVIILDLKGDDLALFEGARIEADRAGLPFRWFTNELGRSSYVFNPLTQRHFSSLSLYQRADVLSAAMGLQYGKDYGKSYYSDANSEVLYKAIYNNPGTSSFSELSQILQNKKALQVERKILQDASHLGTAINRLAACESLNATAANSSHNGAMRSAIDRLRQSLVCSSSLPPKCRCATHTPVHSKRRKALSTSRSRFGFRQR